MKELKVEWFLKFGWWAKKGLEMKENAEDLVEWGTAAAQLGAVTGEMREALSDLGLDMSLVALERDWGPELALGSVGWREAVRRWKENASDGLRRLVDEFGLIVMVALSRVDSAYYQKVQFDSVVVEKFGHVKLDMVEAGKCFALERYQACGFHLYRILEAGLGYAALNLVGECKLDKGWGLILGAMQKAEKNMEKGDSRKAVLKEIDKIMTPIKDLWRNTDIHLSGMRTLGRGEARLLFMATETVMKYIAENVGE